MEKKWIEVIIPCYNEEDCIPLIYEQIHEVAKRMPDYRVSVLYVDDGSSDSSLKRIKEVSANADKEEVHYISFARNFGKEAAIYAGLQNSDADYIALMDADLQHPPTLLLDMVKGIEEGYECCGARRVNRNGEPLIRSFFSRLFYCLEKKMTSLKMEQGVTDYRLMSRKFVNAVLALGEKNRFTKGIFAWVGFETKWIEYENVERIAGDTKWSLSKLLYYAINGFMSFATAPLRGAVYLGFIVMIAALIYGAYIVIHMFVDNGIKSGYSSIMFTILFVGSIIILLLGIIGEYLARIYMEVKNRPIYILKEKKLDKNFEEKA